MAWCNGMCIEVYELGRWHMTGSWDRLLAGPVCWDDNGGLFGIGVRHGAIGVAGGIL